MIVRLAKNLIRRFSRPKESIRAGAAFTLLLWGPEYDFFTKYTADWIGGIRVPRQIDRNILLGPHISKPLLIEALKNASVKPELAIFCGHGSPDALLGPPDGDESDVWIDEKMHSIIYERDLMVLGPTGLFAFCCSSGQGLGRWFSSLPGRSFLGYEGRIPLEVSNQECVATWEKIVHVISAELIAKGSIEPEHRQFVRTVYDQALHYFRDGLGKQNERQWLMQMSLLEHQRLLCYRKGG